MAIAEHSEPQTSAAQAPQGLPPAIDASSNEAPPSSGLAADSDIQNIEAQLRALTARADALDAEATRLQQESSGSEAGDVEQARSQAQAMRGAAEQAQAAIAAAPRDERTGKKRISLTRLEGISALIQRVTIESDKESSDLGTARSEGQTHTAQRASHASANARSSKAKPAGASLLARSGLIGASANRGVGHDDDDDDHYVRTQTLRHEQKPVVWRAVRGTVSPRTINSVTQFAGRQSILGVDEQAARTAEKLTQQATTGNLQQREVAQGEMLDAVARHVGGKTFVGQEIDDALSTLRLNSSIVSAHAHFGYYLTTDNVREALEENGAFTSGYSMFNSYEANRAWSARNVRRIDENADGQLSAIEITHALQNARATMARANAAYQAKEHTPEPSPALNPNQGRIVRLNGYGDIKIEIARANLKRKA